MKRRAGLIAIIFGLLNLLRIAYDAYTKEEWSITVIAIVAAVVTIAGGVFLLFRNRRRIEPPRHDRFS